MDLEIAIEQYKNIHRIHLISQKEFYKKFSLEDAIKNAANGIDPNGNMNNHQRRVGKAKCLEGEKALPKDEINELMIKDFQSLFIITEKVKNAIPKLGDLWSYDTALRIGFKLNFYPTLVYLQCGAKDGAKQRLNKKRISERSLSPEVFEKEFKAGLIPHEIENYLCVGHRLNWFV